MSQRSHVFLSALGVISALGRGKAQVTENLMSGKRPGMTKRSDLLVCGTPVNVGMVTGELPAIPDRLQVYASRNLALSIAAAEEIRTDIDAALERYGAGRIAVVMGTSTSGIAEGEEAIRKAKIAGALPDQFDIRQQEPGSVGEALASYLNLQSVAFTVSTACSSASLAIASGRRLLQTGVADAVIVGGVDSLCQLTINGFHALSALSLTICNPMSRNRDGISIGEGAAVFLMEREESEVSLLGVGSSTDAYSMTAPLPEGEGVESAIRQALKDADISPENIDYIQLHGTGTEQNDSMESKVIKRLFGDKTPCSSSKGQIGHTLGAAGAMGAAHCWLAAHSQNASGILPPHIWDEAAEPELLADSLVKVGQKLTTSDSRVFLSNSFAFGGSNAALIIGRTEHCRW